MSLSIRAYLGVERALRALRLTSVLMIVGGCGHAQSNEHAGVTSQALTGGALTFSVSVPAIADFRSVALGATSYLQIGASDQVVTDTGGFARVTNTGTVVSDVGAGARVGDVYSLANVAVHDNARVVGDVVTADALTKSASGAVTGTSTQHASTLQPATTFSWSVTFPAASGSLIAYQGTTQTAAPGAYSGFFVYPGATMKLTSGVYYFDEFDTEEQSTLKLDTSAGPVIIYVRTSVVYRGATAVTGPPDRLFIGLAGTAPVTIESNFSGVLVAPNAPVRLGIVGKQNSGAIFAQQVQLDPNVRFELHPFAFWRSVTLQAPDIQDCADHIPVRADLTGQNREVAFQQDIARYCSVAGASSLCYTNLAGRGNVDYAQAALQLMHQTLDPAHYLAAVRDRTRKLSEARHDLTFANLLCTGADSDGDWIPDSTDHCPGTPALTATDDQGCPTSTLPDAPSASDVQAVLGSINVPFRAACGSASVPPRTTAGAFYRPAQSSSGTYILATRVVGQPPGCPVWYEFDIEQTGFSAAGGSTQQYQVSFMDREESVDLVGLGQSVPPAVIQFNPLPTDAGTRGQLGSAGGFSVRFRVRAMNGAGVRSGWSDWRTTTAQDCLALGFTCG